MATVLPPPFPRRLARVLVVLLLMALGPSVAMAAPVRGSWVEVRSPHFVAYSDAGEASARRTLEAFEAMRNVFSTLLPGLKVDLHKPVVVIVAENEASMKRFVPDQFAGKDPKRPAGLYMQGRERDYAIVRLDVDHQDNQPFAVMFHEYTHAIVHNNFMALPTWFDEGIAEFYGATEIRSNHVYLGRLPNRHLATLRQGRMPLEEFLRVTHDSPAYMEGSKTGLFYAQSWAMVHFLFMDEEAQKAGLLRSYLRAFAAQADPVETARQGFGDLGKLGERLARYSGRLTFPYLDAPIKVALSDQDFSARPVGVAEALVLCAEFLAHSGKAEPAQALLDQAKALAPGQPQVQAGLGLAAVRKGDWTEARRALLAARAAGSGDFRVPLHLAELALQGSQAPLASPEDILGWLEEARQLQPDFPGLHFALCRVLARDPQTVEKALQAGMTAITLAPSDLPLRLNFGVVLMELGREADAKGIGEQVAGMAREPWERAALASYQAQLAQFLDYRSSVARAASRPAPEPPTSDTPLLEPVPGANPQRPVGKPLKFWLPDSLSDLTREIHLALREGRVDAAIQMVKAALPKAKGPYENSSLKAVLKALQARKAGH